MSLSGPIPSQSGAPIHAAKDARRHARAITQTLAWAREAAARDAFDEALDWLRTVEVVEGELSPDWQETQAYWRRLRAQATPQAAGRGDRHD
ncbi:MAG: hypothetical protein WBQ18_09490 [Solirubrobacteraceae bacterium]